MIGEFIIARSFDVLLMILKFKLPTFFIMINNKLYYQFNQSFNQKDQKLRKKRKK